MMERTTIYMVIFENERYCAYNSCFSKFADAEKYMRMIATSWNCTVIDEGITSYSEEQFMTIRCKDDTTDLTIYCAPYIVDFDLDTIE